jgi:hypothetical protein
MAKKQSSRLSAFLGHKVTQDVAAKLIVAGVLAAAKKLRDSKRVRFRVRRVVNAQPAARHPQNRSARPERSA